MEAEVYPQVLRVDLKSPSGNYYTSTERFASSEEYVKYVDWQMWSGNKEIIDLFTNRKNKLTN